MNFILAMQIEYNTYDRKGNKERRAYNENVTQKGRCVISVVAVSRCAQSNEEQSRCGRGCGKSSTTPGENTSCLFIAISESFFSFLFNLSLLLFFSFFLFYPIHFLFLFHLLFTFLLSSSLLANPKLAA